MLDPLKGFPAEVADRDLDAGSVRLLVDEALYPLEAVYGAAYIFIDRAWVLLDRPEFGRIRVSLAAKDGPKDEAALQALAGEFANELLSCAWRHQIAEQNRATIEAVTMQAISGAMGPPTLEELEKFDFTEEPFEDPLGIAVSWEEKYSREKKADAAAPAQGSDPAPAPGPSGPEKVEPQ